MAQASGGAESVGMKSIVCARLVARSLVSLICATVVIVGCAPTVPPEDQLPAPGPDWDCVAVEGADDDAWGGGAGTWRTEGASLLSVHETAWERAGIWGRPTEEDAVNDALGSGVRAALDLLGQRRVPYGARRRAEIRKSAAAALLVGEESGFPRVRVARKRVERCVDRRSGEVAWRARLLIEYPIGLLRGDVVNALWERRRLAREAEVVLSSASDHFGAGRWLVGQVELARARRLVAEMGIGAPRPSDVGPVDGSGAGSDEVVRRALEALARVGTAIGPLVIESAGGVDVIERGAVSDAVVEFSCTYEWQGRTVGAIGVPVVFGIAGAGAILDADPVTDESGTAVCGIIAGYGRPGEYEIVARLDADVVGAAGCAGFGREIRAVARRSREITSLTADDRTPVASRRIFLVEGAHAISVCVDLEAESATDRAQARAGFVRRMEQDGFRVEECGPDVDVVVTGEVVVLASSVEGRWSAEATLTGAAFDQRSAADVGETTVTVLETSDEGQREAEVVALKEVGRLFAVYLSKRILTSGG